jgi:hypothetical protein
MVLTIHKKKYTAVTSCTLTRGQAGGIGLLRLEIFQLVDEATQHVSKVSTHFRPVVSQSLYVVILVTATNNHMA